MQAGRMQGSCHLQLQITPASGLSCVLIQLADVIVVYNPKYAFD